MYPVGTSFPWPFTNSTNFAPVQKNSICPDYVIFKIQQDLCFKQTDLKSEIHAKMTRQDVLTSGVSQNGGACFSKFIF